MLDSDEMEVFSVLARLMPTRVLHDLKSLWLPLRFLFVRYRAMSILDNCALPQSHV